MVCSVTRRTDCRLVLQRFLCPCLRLSIPDCREVLQEPITVVGFGIGPSLLAGVMQCAYQCCGVMSATWWIQRAEQHGTRSTWAASATFTAAMLALVAALPPGIAGVLTMGAAGAAGGGLNTMPQVIVKEVACSSVNNPKNPQQRARTLSSLVQLSQVCAWGLEGFIVCVTLHFVGYSPILAPGWSRADAAEAAWAFTFGLPITLILLSIITIPNIVTTQKAPEMPQNKIENTAAACQVETNPPSTMADKILQSSAEVVAPQQQLTKRRAKKKQ